MAQKLIIYPLPHTIFLNMSDLLTNYMQMLVILRYPQISSENKTVMMMEKMIQMKQQH